MNRKGNIAEDFSVFTNKRIYLIVSADDKFSKPSKRIKAMLYDQYKEKLLGI